MNTQGILLPRIKRIVSSVVALSFAVVPMQSAFAIEEAQTPPEAESFAKVLNGATVDSSAASDINEIDKIVAAQVEDTKSWANSKEEVVPLLLNAAAKLDEEAKRIEGLRGAAYLQTMIDKNQFMIDGDDFGTAEYRMIEGQRVPRILLNDEVYVLIDEKVISRESPHLRQYIARTHIESGAARVKTDAKGLPVVSVFGGFQRQSGRNLTIAFFNDDANGPELVSMPKPHFTNWAWWKDYWYAKKKKPTWDDFTLALFSGGALQFGLTYIMTMVKHVVVGAPVTWMPAIFTGLFGITIGTFASTYKNFTNNSISNFTRTLKRQFVSSMPYAYGLVIAMAPGDIHAKLATISLFTAAGLAKNLSLQVNGLSNNTAGSYWSGIAQIREKSRDNAGQLVFNLSVGKGESSESRSLINWSRTNQSGQHTFNLNFEVGNAKKTWRVINWSKSNFENQILYLAPWSLNVLGLMAIGASSWSRIPGTEINVPLFQFAGIPIAMLWTRWYARKIAGEAKADPLMRVRARELEELAKRYDSQWANTFGMDVKDIPRHLMSAIRRAIRGVGNVVNGCAALLTKSKGDSD